MRNHSAAALFIASLIALPMAQAQTIERVKMTDNDLSCQQIYNEIIQMDGVIAKASQPTAAGAAPVAAGGGAATSAAAAGVAGAVAQEAIARSGFGGFGGFGGMFGNIAAQAAQGAAQQQAQQAAAQQAAAQQAAAAQAQQGAMLMQQAQGRKEHLTSLFLGKGCKMGDIQK